MQQQLLKWQYAFIDTQWSVVDILTDTVIPVPEITAPHWRAAEQLAMRLNIREFADYASIGEYDWRGITTGIYRHAIMPRSLDSGIYFDNSLTLCDRPTKGMYGFNNSRMMCPECLKVIDTLNDGFRPVYDPKCIKWGQGKLDLAILYINMNNQDYAEFLKAGV